MNESIHGQVRERYGALAERGDSCCSPDFYGAATLEGLPVEAGELSLGCGNPLESAALQPGETVLDLGSGAGIDCFLAARAVGPEGRVIGVDMTPAMLERAEAARERMGLTQVEFREGMIEALPLESDTVDVILSNCVINLTPDKAPVFREAFRVLKPGGRLALSDIVRAGEFSPALMADRGKWSECVTGAIPLADYTSLMGEAGFVEIEVPDMRNADGIIPIQPGMPPLFSARITARKPLA
ncbi:MAG: arsenite methyltransferase [Anaerolineaceae bacterium]|nr:arsenite methyltransferase [Anaerolineaceae bacterium]